MLRIKDVGLNKKLRTVKFVISFGKRFGDVVCIRQSLFYVMLFLTLKFGFKVAFGFMDLSLTVWHR